jgi:predicted secreted protein
MKLKLFLVIISASLLLPLTGLTSCSEASRQISIGVSCEELSTRKNVNLEVDILVIDTLKVTLCSNSSTGFQWPEQAQIDNQSRLRQTDHEVIEPEEDSPPGTPNKEAWTFTARNKGTALVSMEYSQPWEGGTKAEWTFQLTVNVK